jgi:hypothetical protein
MQNLEYGVYVVCLKTFLEGETRGVWVDATWQIPRQRGYILGWLDTDDVFVRRTRGFLVATQEPQTLEEAHEWAVFLTEEGDAAYAAALKTGSLAEAKELLRIKRWKFLH